MIDRVVEKIVRERLCMAVRVNIEVVKKRMEEADELRKSYYAVALESLRELEREVCEQ